MTNALLVIYISVGALNIAIATYFVIKKMIQEYKEEKKDKKK